MGRMKGPGSFVLWSCSSHTVRGCFCHNLRMRFSALLCAVLLAGCSVEADFSDQLETQILPAEQYQQEIAAIDRLLFTEAPLREEGVQALEKLLDDLSKRVGAVDDSKFIKLESLELQLLGKRAGRLSPRGTGRALQNDWMRIRNNLFDDRAWFVRSAADLEYAASVVPPPAPAPVEKPKPKTTTEFIARDEEPRETLTGRWQVTALFTNGEQRTDPELLGSIWTFDPPRLILRDPEGNETIYNFIPDAGYLALMTSSGQEGWMKYESTPDTLRVAFHDGLTGKPKSFDPSPGQKDPMLVVVHLSPVR